jgi:hypothetical protein
MRTIELPLESAPLLGVVRTVLTGAVPDAALIGGLAVTARVASSTVAYRATADVDFVSDDDTPPSFVEVLTARHRVDAPIVINGIKVDVIPTYEVTDKDLAGIDDGPRLFVAGHRWALDTADVVTLSCATPTSTITVEVKLATPAALVAAKSHAVGFARSQRRATKHASDLLDVYRLVDRYHPSGQLVPELQRAPGHIAAVIAGVVRAEYLANPVKASASMASTQGTAISPDDVAQTMAAFVEDLGSEAPRSTGPGSSPHRN